MTLCRWLSAHLYDHGDRDLLLTEMVRPTVAALRDQGRIEAFFFVRYPLGGPHVRLRLRTVAGASDGEPEPAVQRIVEEAAHAFFAGRPAAQPIPEETIRQRNRAILAGDPSEHDGSVHPDRSVRWPAWEPEIERYGGPELFPASLDFFAASSERALAVLAEQSGQPRSRQIPAFFRVLAQQALGLADGPEELRRLAAWSLPRPGQPLEPLVARGDQTFEKSRDPLVALLRAEIEMLGAGGPEILYAERARQLRRAIAAAPPDVRARILTSQMHMTANRLGLHNPEEVYVGRMLQRAVGELGEGELS